MAPKISDPISQEIVKIAKTGFKNSFCNVYEWRGEVFFSIPYRSIDYAIRGADAHYYMAYGREKKANAGQNFVVWVGVVNNSTGEFSEVGKFISRADQGTY